MLSLSPNFIIKYDIYFYSVVFICMMLFTIRMVSRQLYKNNLMAKQAIKVTKVLNCALIELPD